jgi:hypothetical protein
LLGKRINVDELSLDEVGTLIVDGKFELMRKINFANKTLTKLFGY